MTLETLETTLRWASDFLSSHLSSKIKVIFHGGDPLAAGTAFFRQALPRVRQAFGAQHLQLGVQSNLWLLTEELCDLFAQHGVSLSTSLDGPEEITDSQRGQGYFRRTMAGIEWARRRGLGASCICTFTRQSTSRAGEIYDFFVCEGLDFTVNASVPVLIGPHSALPLRDPAPLTRPIEKKIALRPENWSLSPQSYGELLANLLDIYLANLGRVHISTLDFLCRSISAGEGSTCTFRDCLGDYLAVTPYGGIYPCQRFAGHPAFYLGHVQDRPNRGQMEQSPVWRLLRPREERVAEECGDCPYFAHCRGGCPYNALAAGNGLFHALRDPYCPAYQRIFSHITDRALAEVFSEENLSEVVEQPANGTLLRRGPLLTLLRGGPHPAEIAKWAREWISAVALAVSATPEEAATKLDRAGLIIDYERTIASLTMLRRRLDAHPAGRLNLYLHLTYACNLSCVHCYARSGPEYGTSEEAMSVDEMVRLTYEATALNFRKMVITGGEPWVHPQRETLFDALAALRCAIKPILTVLRTNLAYPLTPAFLQRIAHSTDHVVVSVDGDRDSHDARRGAGSFDRVVTNLHALVKANPTAEISLMAVLTAEQAAGEAGKAVKALAEELGGLHVRFKPLLPLGRALRGKRFLRPDVHWTAIKPDEAVAYGFRPLTTCGVGYSLYVGPDGEAYPCYALVGDAYALGNVYGPGGLRGVIESNRYQALARYTVDTNRKCRACALRYLCGGACRAWGNAPTASGLMKFSGSLDDPPTGCRTLHVRARALLDSALDALGVSTERWLAAGLPLPEPNTI